MRRIDPPLLKKIQEQNQTIYKGANPKMSIQVSRAKSTVMDSTYWTVEEMRTKEGLGDLSVAARRQVPYGRPDKLFNIYVDNGTVKTATRDYPSYEEDKWKDQFSLGSGSAVAIAFDGYWELYRDKWQMNTSEKPWVFWANDGILYAQYWDDEDTKVEITTGVSKVKAIRGWINRNILIQDQGVIAAYIKTDGKVYYRNYCMQEDGNRVWENEKEVTQFTGTAVNLNLFITNDYRVGFIIEDSTGKINIYITSRAWAGMGVRPDYISARPGSNAINFIPIKYWKTLNKEKINSSPGASSFNCLYGSSYNEMTAINVDNGDGDYGRKVLVTTKHCMFDVSAEEFSLSNSSTTYNPIGIEVISDTEFVVQFVNFNNAQGDLKLTFTRQTSVNEAGYAFGSMKTTFTPEGLVHVYNPPIVLNVWSVDTQGKQIGIQFSEPLINGIEGNEPAFTVTGQEYLYVNGPTDNGSIVDTEYEVEKVEPHTTVDTILITIKTPNEFNNAINDITITYNQELGVLAGDGGAVESFTYSFTPTNLEARPNPGHAETLSATPGSNTIEFKSIVYTSLFHDKDKISAMPGQSIIDFKEAGIVNP